MGHGEASGGRFCGVARFCGGAATPTTTLWGRAATPTNLCLHLLLLTPQDDVASCFDYYAGLAEKLDGRQDAPIDVGSDDFAVRVRREALGVVGLITPWNYPLLMATVRLRAPHPLQHA